MTLRTESTVLGTFRAQAEACRAMGAPVTARIIDAAADLANSETCTGRRILGLAGDTSPYGNATGLRLAGGLHALARRGEVPALTAFYAGQADDAHAAVRAALAARDGWLEAWLDQPPQTNEVARSAVVMAGLLVAAARFGLPFDLLELGASAGLNLNLGHFRFDLGGVAAGDPASPLVIAPEWRGPPPPDRPVMIRSARGVDLAPIGLADPERAIAYLWIDQPERIARAEAALAIAGIHPPDVTQGYAGDWAVARLAEPQASGVMRMVFHTVAWQYFPDEEQARIRAARDAAGRLATHDAPLGWLGFETTPDRQAYELRLTTWPGGETVHLANAHPHCAWVEWL